MLRYILVFLVIFLLVRAFVIAGLESRAKEPARKDPEPGKNNRKIKKGVPKELGEYVDFEEVKSRD